MAKNGFMPAWMKIPSSDVCLFNNYLYKKKPTSFFSIENKW
jgi:hypothetical protein